MGRAAKREYRLGTPESPAASVPREPHELAHIYCGHLGGHPKKKRANGPRAAKDVVVREVIEFALRDFVVKYNYILGKRTDAKGQETRYVYDAYGRVTQVQHWAGSPLTQQAEQTVNYYYDSNQPMLLLP